MRVKNVVFSALFVAGIVCLLWGFWIPAKAVLAQSLLQRAWYMSLETGQPVKAWPWADSWPIGRLRQPRLGVDLIVLEGASGEALAFGPGRLEGSGQLSESKHSVLAGHRDTSFTFLKDVQYGDKITVESMTRKVMYTVENTQIVSANELYLDREQPQTLSLITCYPFDSVLPQTTMRYLVTATGGGG